MILFYEKLEIFKRELFYFTSIIVLELSKCAIYRNTALYRDTQNTIALYRYTGPIGILSKLLKKPIHSSVEILFTCFYVETTRSNQLIRFKIQEVSCQNQVMVRKNRPRVEN